jgi:hypothetical protein
MKHGLTSSRQAVSQHLEVLEAAGLVLTRREGRYKFHHFDTRPLEHIADRWLGSERGRRHDEKGAGSGTRQPSAIIGLAGMSAPVSPIRGSHISGMKSCQEVGPDARFS